MTNALLKTENLTKDYMLGSEMVHALRGVSVEIMHGDFVAVTGPSGSGKSTFMNLLGCLDSPTSGRYLLDGSDVSGLTADDLAEVRNRKIGFVFQNFNLLARTPAIENVELPLRYSGMPRSQRHARAREVLAAVGLQDRGHHHPSQLSGGQQQRVAIARALANHPVLVLADEPTGALDTQTSVEIMHLLQRLNRDGYHHHPGDPRAGHRQIRPAHPAVPRRLHHRRHDAAGSRAAGDGRNFAPSERRSPMMLFEPVRDAFRALRVNIMRSVLTTLGIIIGVGAVIVMVAVGAGAQAQVAEIINSMGADLLYVFPGSTTSRVRLGAGSLPTLNEEDAEAIQKEILEVEVVAPYIRGRAQIIAGNQNWSTAVIGVTPEYFEAREWSLDNGKSIAAEEFRGNSKVVLVGNTVAQNLFPGQDPSGSVIRINRVPFKVAGVLQAKGYSMGGWDQDDLVIIPMAPARKKVLGERALSGRLVNGIAVKVISPELVSSAEKEIRELLRQRHRLRPSQENDFWIRNQAEALESRAESSRTMSLLLAAVASVSLMVGGIGIMNIMIVSVTERTREIGLRMAVGARRHDILMQFLTEAVALSMIGGLIGILLGVAGSMAFTAFGDWPAIIQPSAIAIAFTVSAAVGIFFGFYPARKASRLDPIEALRRE